LVERAEEGMGKKRYLSSTTPALIPTLGTLFPHGVAFRFWPPCATVLPAWMLASTRALDHAQWRCMSK
jgi:hypothetical protein